MIWAVERRSLAPSAFHALALPEPLTRTVWVCDATVPALVLGSTQPDALVDAAACARAGVEVVRRRSGGGAVLVVPGDLLWVDLLLPRADPLWQDDVEAASHWVGDLFAEVLAQHGLAAVVHRGGLEPARWGREVCFAGLGPGEVAVGGAKVVGVAQRRSRHGARFQCAVLHRWDPEALLSLLHLPSAVGADLTDVAAGLSPPPERLLATLLDRLP